MVQYLFEARSDFILKQKDFCLLLYKILLKQCPEEIPVLKEESQQIDIVKDFLLKLEEYKFISKYLVWVVKQYANNSWLFPEDLEKIENNLNKFYRSQTYLKNNDIETDINKYNMQSFNKLILELPETNRQEDIQIKNNEAEKIYEDSNWLLVSPKTENAAILYGKHTHWCTASTEGKNYFNYYNDQGPLYIIINKNNPEEKFQFHLPTQSFMDVDDIEVDIDEMDTLFDNNKKLKNTVQQIVVNHYKQLVITELSINEEDFSNFLNDLEIEHGYYFGGFTAEEIINTVTNDEIPSQIWDYEVEAEDILSHIDYDIMNLLENEFNLFKDKEVKEKVRSFLFDNSYTKTAITPLNNFRKLIISSLNEFEVGKKYSDDKIQNLKKDYTEWVEQNLKELLQAKAIRYYYGSLEIQPIDSNYISNIIKASITTAILNNDEIGYYYLHSIPIKDNTEWEYYYDSSVSDEFEEWYKESFLTYLKHNLAVHKHILESLREWNPYEEYNGVEEKINYDPYDDSYRYRDEDDDDEEEINLDEE